MGNAEKITAFSCSFIPPGLSQRKVEVERPSGTTPLSLHRHLATHADHFSWGRNTEPTMQLSIAICAELFEPELALRAATAVKHRFLVFAEHNQELRIDASEVAAFVERRFAGIPA